MTAPVIDGSVQPQPVAVAGCLGWLHLPPPGQLRGRGVVICAPWGHEALCAYRGLYDLAQRCAANGLPTLRLDYPGTGDSPGDDAPGRFDASRDAIVAATAWLQTEARVAEVALCGFRLGCMLAAEAAASLGGRIAAVALLSPPVSGRALARQITLAARAAETADTGPGCEWLELGGDLLHQTELVRLARSEPADALSAARIPRILLLERSPALAARLADLGEVTSLPFKGADVFAKHHLAPVPCEDFARVADWLAESAASAQAEPQPSALPAFDLGPDGMEQPVRFGPNGVLAGVLSTPSPELRRRVAVLLLNTGALPRAGAGRFGVRLSRHLARLGFATLRMDTTGVGDSAAPCGQHDETAPPDMFRDELVAEAQAGLDLLGMQGATRCLVVGVCSGAHVALQLARRDGRADAVALFNLPAFDRSAGGAPALDGGPPPGEIPLLRRPKMLLRRLCAEADAAIAALFGVEAGLDRPGNWMRALSARGVGVLLAYSARDRGLRELRAHFGRRGRRLARFPNVRRVVLDGTEHSLSPRIMQAQALRLIEEEALLLDRAPAALRVTAAAETWAGMEAPAPGASIPAS